jgi:hypothetical protein
MRNNLTLSVVRDAIATVGLRQGSLAAREAKAVIAAVRAAIGREAATKYVDRTTKVVRDYRDATRNAGYCAGTSYRFSSFHKGIRAVGDACSSRAEAYSSWKRNLQRKRRASRESYTEWYGGRILTKQRERRAQLVFERKCPMTNENHVGVEIEFFTETSQSTLGAMLNDAGLAKYVELKDDGSIRADYGDGMELAVVCPQAKYREVMESVCSVLRDAEAGVNRSTGLHVHIDMRNRDAGVSYNNLVACQQQLLNMVPASRRENSYCKPVRGRELAGKMRKGERYRTINHRSMDRHGTLEVRLHNGTTDATKINSWVALLIGIADAPMIAGVIRTAAGMGKACDLSDEIVGYVKGRQAKFKVQAADGSSEAAA